MTKVSNLPDLIETEFFRQWEGGILIDYNFFGKIYHIVAPPPQAADMLHEGGYITAYAVKGDLVVIERLANTGLTVDKGAGLAPRKGYIQQTWEEYVAEVKLERWDALSLAAGQEAKKELLRAVERVTAVKKIAADDQPDTILTFEEIALWRSLERIPPQTTWGRSIDIVKKACTPLAVRELIRELQEYAAYSPGGLRHTIGAEVFDQLVNLPV